MSETRDQNEAAYLRAVEERFRALRGRPLLISPADFRVAQQWFEAGVPLWLVETVLDDIFKRAQAGSRSPPRSLRYCRSAIEEACKVWRAGQVSQPSSSEGGSDQTLLERADAALRVSSAPAAARQRALRDIAELGVRDQAGEGIVAIDRALIDACLASLDPADRARLENDAQRDIAPWAAEMSPDVLERALDRARARLVRARFVLPDLTVLAFL